MLDIGKATLEEIRAEWSKVNSDPSSIQAFGEGISPNQSFARQLAETAATNNFIRKKKAEGNINIKGFNLNSQKLFQNTNREFISLILVDIPNYTVEDAAVNEKPQPISKPKDPPPPPSSPAPARSTFVPAALIAGPYYTKGGEFRKKSTGEDYVGDYIRVVEGRYRTGKSIQEPGEELVLVSNIQTARDTVNNWVDTNIVGKVKKLGIKNPLNALNLSGIFDISSILTTLLTLSPTEREKRQGEMKRYVIQDKNTLKIAEVDKDTFLLAKNNLFNKKFVEIPWKISGPAENTTIAGYPAVGVSTVNKQTITALEKEIPGISAFITDYTFLLQTPEPRDREIFTEEKITTSPLSALEAFKKANFDKKD